MPKQRPAKRRGGKTKKKPRSRPARGRGILSRLRPPLLWALGLVLALAGVCLVWWWEAREDTPAQPGQAALTGQTAAVRPAHGAGGANGVNGASGVNGAGGAVASLPMPPYEEEPAPGAGGRELQEVDEALFAGLRLAGLEPAAVRLSVRPTPQGEIAVLEAQLPPEINPQNARAKVQERLAATQGKGSWRVSAQEMLLEVYLGGQPTHLLRLILPGAPRPAPPTPPAPPAPPRPPAAGGLPQVAIVIDDLGYLLEPARKLLALDLNLTMSVLPRSPHGREIAAQARAKGLEVLLHLPMEARAHSVSQLGPGALLTRMGADELRRLTLEDLAAVPGAAGVNNHMGSLFSESPEALRPVLATLREQGLFFLDSVTSSRSQAYALARGLGLRASQRDIFLDHQPSRAAVDLQLTRLLQMARHQGRAIAIGHPHSATVEALAAFAPRLRREVELVPVSRLMEEPAGEAARELDRAAARP